MTPERQVLYGVVAAAFHVVVAVLIIGAAPVVPGWWTVTLAGAWLVVTVTGARHWRATARLLAMTIGLFLSWAIGTVVVL